MIMTNIPNNPKLANLQKFYKKFPMQNHATVSIAHKSIVYMVPDIFLDTIMESAECMIAKMNLPMVVIKSDMFETCFIVKEIAA